MPTQPRTIRLREHGWVAFYQDHDIEADSLEQAVERIDTDYADPMIGQPVWDVRHTSYYECEPVGQLLVQAIYTVVLMSGGLHETTRVFTDEGSAREYHEAETSVGGGEHIEGTITKQLILIPKAENHAHPDAT